MREITTNQQPLAIRVPHPEVLEEALHQAPTFHAEEFLMRLDRLARELSSETALKVDHVCILADRGPAVASGRDLAPIWRELCEAKATSYRTLARATRRDGLWALRYGAIAFVTALAISIILDQTEPLPPWLNRPFVEGFVIASWVSLWRPLELLLYEWLPFGRIARTFDRLAPLPIRVAATSTSSETSAPIP